MSYPPPGPDPYPVAQPSAEPVGTNGGGRTLIWLGVVGLVVGVALIVAGAVVLGTKSLTSVNDFERVPIAQASGTVTFSGTGSYLAYYESDDVSSRTNRVPLPLIQLRSPTGRVRTLDTLYGGRSRDSLRITTHLAYSFNGHHGIAIYQFRITEKGAYEVAITQAGNADPGSDIAFGKSVGGGLVLGIALIVPGVVLALAGIVVLIVGLIQRANHKRQHRGGTGYPPQQPYLGQQFYPQQTYPQQPYPGQPPSPPPYPAPGT